MHTSITDTHSHTYIHIHTGCLEKNVNITMGVSL